MNYLTQVIESLEAVGRETWDAVVARDADSNPFLRFDFLHALHESDSACEATGWSPRYLTVWDDGRLAAATPLYAKSHSYGEYVFDWAWADAHRRYGMAYYPKWLVAVPFTPVGGTRLIATDDGARAALAEALVAQARATDLSSLHVLLAPQAQIDSLACRGLHVRHGVQFHWHNRGDGERYTSFDDFLARLTQPKRKKIRAERRKVAEEQITLVRKVGADINAADWAFFFRCYCNTYEAHGSPPYLNLAFFEQIGAAMPEHLMLVLALRGARPIAAALGVFDDRRLYGRYWGAVEHVPCLHFECCYYQMIDFAIERRLDAFEGGAQGTHKLARGLDPVPTRSAHWLADPRMHDAVGRFVARETVSVDHALDELNEHRAFRRGPWQA